MLGLVLDGISARGPSSPPGWTDRAQLVNLAGAAWLSARFLTGRVGVERLARWQTASLPVLAVWAAVVVVVFPPLFGFG